MVLGVIALLLVIKFGKIPLSASGFYRGFDGIYRKETCASLLSGGPGCRYLGLLPVYLPVKGADPFTFRSVDKLWAKDRSRMYCGFAGYDMDPGTFRALGAGYFADDRQVRRSCMLLQRRRVGHTSFENFDPATFEVLPCGYLKDATGVYVKGHGGLMETTLEGGFMVSSAFVPVTNRPEELDINHACEVAGLRMLGCGFGRLGTSIVFTSSQAEGKYALVEGANADRFELLANPPGAHCGYAQWGTDGESVWWGTWRIEGADPETFKEVPGIADRFLACDRRRRYEQGVVLDPRSPYNSEFAAKFEETCPRD